MFQIGDVLVYPFYGILRLIGIKREKIGNSDRLCYILEPEIKAANESSIIKLPVDRAEQNRVRKMAEQKEVLAVLEILKDRTRTPDCATSTGKLREYSDRIAAGGIHQAAEVYRDLLLLKEARDLSHAERRLLDQVRSMLIRELSAAEGTDESSIGETLAAIFKAPPSRKLHLMSRENKWIVKKEGAERVSGTFETKEEAAQYGRDLLKKTHDAELVIHRRDGSVESTVDSMSA